MMRRIIYMLIMCAILMLAGCGDIGPTKIQPSGESTVPETTAPETTAPETTAPETTVPEATVPETTAPETTAPETTVPETTEQPEQASDAYAQLLDKYAAALAESASGGTLISQDLNYMMADCYGAAPLERIGYALLDLDGDGITELIVGTMPVIDDAFYGKLIFDMYSLDETGAYFKICTSTERDRYYYAGGERLANVGSAGAAYDYVTTLKLQDGELLDMTYTTDVADYVQLELKPFAKWTQ